MTRRYWPLILTLAAVWGASYLFIKVGVDGGLSPAALMASRAFIAGFVLIAYLWATIGIPAATREIRSAWRACVSLGAHERGRPLLARRMG